MSDPDELAALKAQVAQQQAQIDELLSLKATVSAQQKQIDQLLELAQSSRGSATTPRRSFDDAPSRPRSSTAGIAAADAAAVAAGKHPELADTLVEKSQGAIVVQGMLGKRGAVNSSWKKRYFVLGNDQTLRYFKGSEFSGYILLSEPGVHVVHQRTLRSRASMTKSRSSRMAQSVSGAMSSLKDLGHGRVLDLGHVEEHTFQIETPERTFHLAAASGEEVDMWIAALRASCSGEATERGWATPRAEGEPTSRDFDDDGTSSAPVGGAGAALEAEREPTAGDAHGGMRGQQVQVRARRLSQEEQEMTAISRLLTVAPGGNWERRLKEAEEQVSEGKKANQAGNAEEAAQFFEEACRIYPRAAWLVSAVNMRRKLGVPQHAACAQAYVHILALAALSDDARGLIEKNCAECLATAPDGTRATLEAEVDRAAVRRYERLAAEAAGFIKVFIDLLDVTEKEVAATSWAARKQQHDRLVAQGKEANQAGSTQEAIDAFERATRCFPKMSTLVSAVNMRRKLCAAEGADMPPEKRADECATCALAYLAILRMELGDEMRASVERWCAECVASLPDGVSRDTLDASVDELACQRFEVLAAEAGEEGSQEEGALFNGQTKGFIRIRGFVDEGGKDGWAFGK